MQKTDHEKRVSSWMGKAAKDAPPGTLIVLFETAWGALWRRAESAVGEIALQSISDVIASNSIERYPFLGPLELKSADVSCKALLEAAEKNELKESFRFILVEFITVIGDLTDQILTPGLYDALPRVSPESKEHFSKSRSASRRVMKNETEQGGNRYARK